jgi:phosphopantetheine--protein transferase-like protein
MSPDPGAWLEDYFATVSRDLTPPSLPEASRALFAPLSGDSEVSRCCAAVLSHGERRRAQRFAGEAERDRYVQRRAFRRFCAALALGLPETQWQIDFAETDKGRPYLGGHRDVCFSFSSSRAGLLAAWSATHSVGVDLEDESRNVEAVTLARRYFCEGERRAIESLDEPEQLQLFFRYWCLKEAALKSIGEGLPSGLDAFEFDVHPKPRVLRAPSIHGGAPRFEAHLIDGTVFCAALVLHDPPFKAGEG